MSLPKGSTWQIERERDGKTPVPDRNIKITSVNGERFTAEYVGIDNPSEFNGEVWARETKVLNLKQQDHSTGYVAFHSALRKGTNNKEYEGRWFDNAGNRGAFGLHQL